MPTLLEATRREVATSIEGAALELFVKKGYAGTTVRDIADACGLTPGALYTHFPSKEDLFRAVVEGYQKRLASESPLREVLTSTSFPNDLPALAASVRDLVRRHRQYWILWYVDVIEFEGVHFKSALAPSMLLAVPALKERLETLADEGSLRIDPHVAFVMTYMHFFNYFIVENIFGGKDHYGISEAKAIEVMTEVLLRGMLVDDGSRPAKPRKPRSSTRRK